MNNNVNSNTYDRHEERRQRRAERRALRNGAGWMGGVMIILLGLILLAQNMNMLVPAKLVGPVYPAAGSRIFYGSLANG